MGKNNRAKIKHKKSMKRMAHASPKGTRARVGKLYLKYQKEGWPK